MALGKFTKTPDEAKRYAIDYSEWLDATEYIANISFNVVSTNSGVLFIAPGSLGTNPTEAIFFVTGGSAGQTYTVGVTMTTTTNQVKQDTIIYSVRSLT